MEIFLSPNCKSFTGNVGSGYGYFIVNREGRFFSQRSRHEVPYNGHWLFIKSCAFLAANKMHIADIEITGAELGTALLEAKLRRALFDVNVMDTYNADFVNHLVTKYNL